MNLEERIDHLTSCFKLMEINLDEIRNSTKNLEAIANSTNQEKEKRKKEISVMDSLDVKKMEKRQKLRKPFPHPYKDIVFLIKM